MVLTVYEYLQKNCDIVGLAGFAGSGKDTVAKKYFVDQHGYYNVSFAWHFKVEAIFKGSASYKEVFDTKPPRVRRLLQILGTEQGRHLWGQDVWVDTMFCWARLWSEHWGINKFVFTDIRFPNELTAIQKCGGKVFRVISNMSHGDLIDRDKFHESEVSLMDDDPRYDGIIYNYMDENHQWSDNTENINNLLNT